MEEKKEGGRGRERGVKTAGRMAREGVERLKKQRKGLVDRYAVKRQNSGEKERQRKCQ